MKDQNIRIESVSVKLKMVKTCILVTMTPWQSQARENSNDVVWFLQYNIEKKVDSDAEDEDEDDEEFGGSGGKKKEDEDDPVLRKTT